MVQHIRRRILRAIGNQLFGRKGQPGPCLYCCLVKVSTRLFVADNKAFIPAIGGVQVSPNKFLIHADVAVLVRTVARAVPVIGKKIQRRSGPSRSGIFAGMTMGE